MFRLVRRAVGFGLLLAVMYGAVTFVQVWMASRRDPAVARGSAEAIVVLGAAQYDGRPSPVLRARLDHAAELWARHVAAVIVVTGGQASGDESRNTEASASADYLFAEYDVPHDSILRENDACSTWDSLAFTATELRRLHGRDVRVVLVSDPFHSARVAAMASELRLDAVVSPTRTSPIGGAEELRHMVRETLVVAAGRVVGFRRLMGVDEIARPSSSARARCG